MLRFPCVVRPLKAGCHSLGGGHAGQRGARAGETQLANICTPAPPLAPRPLSPRRGPGSPLPSHRTLPKHQSLGTMAAREQGHRGPPHTCLGGPHLPAPFIRPAARITFLFSLHAAAPAPDLLESAFTPASSTPQHSLYLPPLSPSSPHLLSLLRHPLVLYTPQPLLAAPPTLAPPHTPITHRQIPP